MSRRRNPCLIIFLALGLALSGWVQPAAAAPAPEPPPPVSEEAPPPVYQQPAEGAADPLENLAVTASVTLDDSSSSITYSGAPLTWTVAADASAYMGAYHYSNTPGSSASFSFSGVQFSVLYTAASGNGRLSVTIDGVFTASINQNNSTSAYLSEWSSPLLTPGLHSVVLTNSSTGATPVNLDALITQSDVAPVDPGEYDDSDLNLSFSGTWSVLTSSYYRGGSTHSSSSLNNSASIAFNGNRFSIIFTKRPTGGTMRVTVDGVEVTGSPISMTSAGGNLFQQQWDSPLLSSSGPHTLVMTHLSGAQVDIDGLNIQAAPDWNDEIDSADEVALSGSYFSATQDTTAATTAFDDPLIPCLGRTQGYHTVWYSFSPTQRGTLQVDTAVSAYNTILAVWYGSRGNLTNLACNNSGTSSSSLSFSASVGMTYFIEVASAYSYSSGTLKFNAIFTPYSTPTTYDDRDARLVYAGAWFNESVAGAVENTMRYSRAGGNYVALSFNGTQASVIYGRGPELGTMEIVIDNQLPVRISQYAAARSLLARWDSPTLPNGMHTITVRHHLGGRIDFDAFVVNATISPSLPGPGTYDDTHGGFQYSPSWLTYTGTRFYNKTLHGSRLVGNRAVFNFTGSQFILVYTAAPNRGKMNIYLDGVLVKTLNQYRYAFQWQKRWTSAPFENTSHTLTLEQATRGLVDIDALIITSEGQQPGDMGLGLNDDTHSGLVYRGAWTAMDNVPAGPYRGTFHYSRVVGNTISFAFTGSQFALLYANAPNRGKMRVFVDGKLVKTINENYSSVRWKRKWTSAVMPYRRHTVVLQHYSGKVVDLDAVTIN